MQSLCGFWMIFPDLILIALWFSLDVLAYVLLAESDFSTSLALVHYIIGHMASSSFPSPLGKGEL